MFCTKCGAQHPDDTNFCTFCGNKLRNVLVVAVAEEPEAVPEVAAPVAEVIPEAAPEAVLEPVPEAEPIAESVSEAEPIAEPVPEVVPEAVEEPAPEAAPEEAPASEAVPETAGESAPVGIPEPPAEAAPKKKKKGGKKIVLIIVAAVLVLALLVVGGYFLVNELSYNDATTLIEEKDYDAALEKLDGLKGYRDSADLAAELRHDEAAYDEASALLESGDLDGAAALLKDLDDYSDAADILDNITAYQDAAALADAYDYAGATEAFAALGDFYDSEEMAASGVDLIQAQHLMDFAASEDLAGYEAIDPSVTSLDEAAALALRADLYQQAAKIYANCPDSADQANECLYQAAALLLEQANYDSALALREQMDDATAERFDATYQSYCADTSLWDSIMASTDLVPPSSDALEYKAGLENQIDFLEALLDDHYANEELPALVESYIAGVENELAPMDENGIPSDWVATYASYSEQYAALSALASALELDQETIDAFANAAEIYGIQSSLEAMLTPCFNADEKTDGTGEYTNYLVVENTSEYAFSLIYEITWYDGDTYLSTDETTTIDLEPGDSADIPLIIPEGYDSAEYSIFWETFNITLNGELLPGQE